jgi:hypothetical protein
MTSQWQTMISTVIAPTAGVTVGLMTALASIRDSRRRIRRDREKLDLWAAAIAALPPDSSRRKEAAASLDWHVQNMLHFYSRTRDWEEVKSGVGLFLTGFFIAIYINDNPDWEGWSWLRGIASIFSLFTIIGGPAMVFSGLTRRTRSDSFDERVIQRTTNFMKDISVSFRMTKRSKGSTADTGVAGQEEQKTRSTS